ncbi:MAG TPA: sigma-54 dependent transcriptional regulator, partial [Cytophagales bacterium]|nr:sigma-54 dependent transcriptional regulator [Cytophagales bacterium]
MNNTRIFIVEDDKFYRSLLDHHLSLNPDYEVHKFSTGKECLSNLHLNPDVITLDYSLPDTTGYEILRKIRSNNKDIPVIIVSGQDDIGTAVELLKEGAYDYITKDANTPSKLWNALLKVRETQDLKKEISELREEVSQKYTFEKVLKGNSESIKKIFALMEKAGKSNITVSITGETGTGKEVVAKAIHYNSGRSSKPFVAVNMSAIPKELAESELFGYEKGAFTGASTRRVGKFEEANQGTIFLDEIAEMDLSLQSKILRVIQEREVTRVGGNGSVKLDVRIIVATHKNLQEEVKKGTFREDLYYRLLGLPINLPPLRERDKDVLVIAKHFVEEFCKQN